MGLCEQLGPDFLGKLVLLVVGALITGLGLPWVLRTIDSNKQRQQKVFESDLARQTKLIDAQSALLDALTKVVWTWRYLAKEVVYYGAVGDTERYNKARATYEERVWHLLGELRTEISRARRLVSEAAFRELNQLYAYIVYDIDMKVRALADAVEPDLPGCRELADRFSNEVSAKLDDALLELAKQFHLTSGRPDAARD